MTQRFFIIFLLSHNFLFSQNSISDVLRTALNDEKYRATNAMQATTEATTFHVPYIRKAELRMGINGNALSDTIYGNIRNEDFYGFVVSPNSLREIKQQKGIKTAYKNIYASEQQLYLHQALADRYLTLTSLNFVPELQKEKQKLFGFLDQKVKILEQTMAQGGDIKVKDVIDTENDKNFLKITVADLENQAAFQTVRIQQFLNTKEQTSIDFNNFISIEKITEVINEAAFSTPTNPLIPFKEAQSAYEKARLNLVNAENRQIFNFLQIGYQNPIFVLERPDKQKSVNNFQVRIGLTAPISGNNNPDKSKYILAQKEAENDIETTTQLNQKAVVTQLVKVQNLIRSYAICNEQIGKSMIKKMLDNPTLTAQITPLELLELHIAQQKLLVRRLEIKQELTAEYVRFLDLNGKISQTPLRNYLSQNLENF